MDFRYYSLIQTLIDIDLGQNDIHSEGIRHLAQALEKNTVTTIVRE